MSEAVLVDLQLRLTPSELLRIRLDLMTSVLRNGGMNGWSKKSVVDYVDGMVDYIINGKKA